MSTLKIASLPGEGKRSCLAGETKNTRTSFGHMAHAQFLWHSGNTYWHGGQRLEDLASIYVILEQESRGYGNIINKYICVGARRLNQSHTHMLYIPCSTLEYQHPEKVVLRQHESCDLTCCSSSSTPCNPLRKAAFSSTLPHPPALYSTPSKHTPIKMK